MYVFHWQLIGTSSACCTLKLRTHYSWSRPVNTGVTFDARVYGPWSWGTRFDARVHGPWSRVTRFDARVHGPWSWGTRFDGRVYGPWYWGRFLTAVFTGSVYATQKWTIWLLQITLYDWLMRLFGEQYKAQTSHWSTRWFDIFQNKIALLLSLTWWKRWIWRQRDDTVHVRGFGKPWLSDTYTLVQLTWLFAPARMRRIYLLSQRLPKTTRWMTLILRW